ncbi:hypothetical protein SASPL_124854 [Salvia splendens]|uniref:Glycoside hydrolase family 3 N-terminal domain-containing protein n=1 Tax=Salvia splendens TaxID=180675 RepID=A0A8X8ZQ82_SALSN|nr:hypothetical protein SASPL_124854 [Salvia splendens]
MLLQRGIERRLRPIQRSEAAVKSKNKRSNEEDDIRGEARPNGSVLRGGGSVPAPQATPEAWVDMVNELQKGSLSTRLGIPMIYGIDGVHGHNNVYNATIFPHNIGLGATRDPQLVKRIGAATALEIRATGIPYTFAPTIAVCRDPGWGRCYESYDEDPSIVRAMTELIPGLQGDIPPNSPKGVPYLGGQ